MDISFVIGLLLLKLLHHNAPFFVLASLVLKPNPDDPRAEASHFYQLLFHEGVRSGVGSVAGPQGVKLFFIKDSPDSSGLLGLLVDVGPQSWLSGRDRFCCHLQRPGGMQGAEGVPPAQAGPLHHVVVRPAEEAVLPQREFIAGDELAAAGHAAETLDVVHLGAGAHHEVILAEADAAFGALDAV